jgi:hypothetical protein
MGRKPRNQTRGGIQKRVSQKPYERDFKRNPRCYPQDKLEEEKDLEEMEEEGIDLERGEDALVQNKGIPEDKNRKIPSETISDQNQGQRSVYKYD